MPASETGSAVTSASRRRVLRNRDFEDGMICRAEHSVKHAIVQALASNMPAQLRTPDSVLMRDLAGLPALAGKSRPFVVLDAPRGNFAPARIVLATHFDGRPVAEADACAQTLAVALGSASPGWPAADSPRVRTEPEWHDDNSYLLAFPIALQPGRGPTRFRKAGIEYRIEKPELAGLRALCRQREDSLAAMSSDDLEALKASYEAHSSSYRPPARSSVGGSIYATRSQISCLPSICEDGPTTPVASVTPATPAAPVTNENEEDRIAAKVKRRASAMSQRSTRRR